MLSMLIMIHELWKFLVHRNRHHYWQCLSARQTLLLPILRGGDPLLPQSWPVTYICQKALCSILRGTLHKSPDFSLLAALSSPILCPTNFGSLILPDSQQCFLNWEGPLGFAWAPHFPHCGPEVPSSQDTGVVRGLILFSISHLSLSFTIWCPVPWKTVVSNTFVYL